MSSDELPLQQKMGSETDSLVNPGKECKGRFEKYFQPCLAELVGVTLFVFLGCLSVQDPLGVGTAGRVVPSAAAVAVAHGFSIALLVMGFGCISGGHFNPAVTLGVTIGGGISPLLAVGYFVSQIIGAILGASLCRAVLPLDIYTTINGGAHTLNGSVSVGSGILCEIILTTVLVMTVLLAAVDEKSKSPLAPLAIGFAVTVDILAGINVTGASMNPARSFGPAVAVSVYKGQVWDHHYIYWVGPLGGALLASLLYRLILASPDKRFFLKN